MPRTTLLVIAVALLGQGWAVAEDAAAKGEERPSADTGDRSAPRPAIRVLRNPYDLSSFYRSGGSAPGGWAGLADDPAYGIADFYRSQRAPSPGGWSRFWTSGYDARRPTPLPAYRRTIGENGDLFLVVPFLAPVGPITGAFFDY